MSDLFKLNFQSATFTRGASSVSRLNHTPESGGMTFIFLRHLRTIT